MSVAVLDTHSMIKELREAGFNESQAQAQAHLARIVFDTTVEYYKEETNAHKMVSIEDLRNVEFILKSDLKDVESRLKGDMKDLEFKLTGDMKSLESNLIVEMEKLRSETRVELHKTKSSLLFWMFGMHTVQIGLIIGLFGKAFKFF